MRFRLYPSAAQKVLLAEQCGHARYVWNLGLEQHLMWRRWQGPTPGFSAQSAQLTEARAAAPWLVCGSQTVQQQALRDLDQGWRNFFAGTHRRPRWRKAGEDEGLRIVGPQAVRVRRDNRARSSVLVGEDRLGLVQTQPCTGRVEVVSHHRRAVGPLAYRVRCDP
jgi:putative transposase